jgi:hypothetical protein
LQAIDFSGAGLDARWTSRSSAKPIRRRPALSTGPDTASCRLQPLLPETPAKILFALSQAAPSLAAMIGRTETLKPGVRPNTAARARNSRMRSRVDLSGSA